MPAVTVDDVLVLPRLPALDPAQTSFRGVQRIVTAPSGFEGEGFPVRRAFAGVPLTELDPFIHLDQMGEVEYAPGEPKGTPWHPHRGFETVTYMIDGIFEHQDSNGGGGIITNGDTQWMTAGAGILHIEAPPEQPGRQRRPVPRPPAVGQPAPGEEDGAAALPGHPRPPGGLLTSPDGGALIRRDRRRARRPPRARASRTPRSRSLHITLEPGAQLDLPWRPDYNALVYVLGGKGTRRRRAAADPHRSAGGARRRGRAAGGRRRRPGRAHARSWSCISWAGSRSASRWRTTARS